MCIPCRSGNFAGTALRLFAAYVRLFRHSKGLFAAYEGSPQSFLMAASDSGSVPPQLMS